MIEIMAYTSRKNINFKDLMAKKIGPGKFEILYLGENSKNQSIYQGWNTALFVDMSYLQIIGEGLEIKNSHKELEKRLEIKLIPDRILR